MTIRPNYESLMPDLLRVAPYIDIEELRKKMEDHAQSALDGCSPTSIHRPALQEFMSGEGHVLPFRFGLTDSLYLAMHQMMVQNLPEGMLPHAFTLYKPYFFQSDVTLGIGR